MFEHNIKDIKYSENTQTMCGIYIGPDIWFVSRMQAFDIRNFHLIHCYTFEEASAVIHNQNISPDLILTEYELSDNLAQLKQSPELMSCELLRPLFLLISDELLSEEEINFSGTLAIDDVLFKSTSTDLLFERICFLHSRIQSSCTANYEAPKNTSPSPLKRSFDIAFSAAALAFSAPLFFLLIVFIKLHQKGPVFTKVKRVGAGYKTFNLYQLKLMNLDNTKQNDIQDCNTRRYYTYTSDDHNCSECEQLCRPCSPLLRIEEQEICERLFLHIKTKKLDEETSPESDSILIRLIKKSKLHLVPRFVNVLRGNISIVGNRPLKVHEAERLTTDKDSIRFTAPAGIITMAHAIGKGNGKELDLNLLYAQHNSFVGDIKILIRSAFQPLLIS